MKQFSLGRHVALFLPVIVTACTIDRPTEPSDRPAFAISDAVHSGGTSGFYFLPPMVPQPVVSGTFDADIAALNPQIAICDITVGTDVDCGAPGGTPAAIVFTTTSSPAISLHPTAAQYQVNWDTKGAAFTAGSTYRVHVAVTDLCGQARPLGYADVLLTTTPGQVKQLATGITIVLQDGRTLPIHFRVESAAVGNCWTTVAPMPTPRSYVSVAVVNGMLYAIGGQSEPAAGGPTGRVEAYDPATDTWTTKATRPTLRNGPGVGVVNGVIYVVGGRLGDMDQATVEAYDPATDAWTTKAPMPTPRLYLGVGVVNGILYAFGGGGSTCCLATVAAYDPATDRWTAKAPMPVPIGYTNAGVVNGVLYAVASLSDPPVSQTLLAYDPATDTWAAKAAVPQAGFEWGVGAANGVLYAVAGGGPGALGTNYAYNPVTDMWTTRAMMPGPRIGIGMGVLNGLLYAVGGYALGYLIDGNQDPTGRVDVYHP